MTKYNSKNPVSGPFSQFWRQIFFPSKNPVLSHITSYGFLPPCQNLEKLMMQFQENAQTDRRTEGQANPYFIGPSSYCPGVQ